MTPPGLALVKQELGQLETLLFNFEAAQAQLDIALADYRMVKSTSGEAYTLLALGNCKVSVNALDQALCDLGDASRIFTRLVDKKGQGACELLQAQAQLR